MRKRINSILENSPVYNWFMIVIIIASMIPLAFKEPPPLLHVVDIVAVSIFIADYIARWITADLTSQRFNKGAFLTYPIRPMAIIDLLSILPSIVLINPAFRAFRVLRLIRALRVFRLFRYSKSVRAIVNVLIDQKNSLLAVGGLAIGYILISALILFQIEPETFDNYYDAIYWATISLTTVGYGDIFAQSDIGRLMTMISAVVGIAIVALPAGVITAGYLEEIKKYRSDSRDDVK